MTLVWMQLFFYYLKKASWKRLINFKSIISIWFYVFQGGRTLLQIAAENGNDDIVKFLLENNARIDICDYVCSMRTCHVWKGLS